MSEKYEKRYYIKNKGPNKVNTVMRLPPDVKAFLTAQPLGPAGTVTEIVRKMMQGN